MIGQQTDNLNRHLNVPRATASIRDFMSVLRIFLKGKLFVKIAPLTRIKLHVIISSHFPLASEANIPMKQRTEKTVKATVTLSKKTGWYSGII